MSEEQADYKKSITAKELLIFCGSFAHQKTMENNHKDNILARDFENLLKRYDEEIAEFKQAFRIWQSNRTEKNLLALCKEHGDCLNFGNAIIGKAAGYEILIRE